MKRVEEMLVNSLPKYYSNNIKYLYSAFLQSNSKCILILLFTFDKRLFAMRKGVYQM